MRRRVTTRRRQVLSLFVGAAVVGGLMLIPELAAFSHEADYSVPEYAGIAVIAFVLSTVAGLAAIVAIGLPLWLVLQRVRRDTIWAALAVGALAPTATFAALLLTEAIAPSGSPAGSIWVRVFGGDAWFTFGVISVLGAAIALAMWLSAYRKQRDPAEVFD